MSIFGDLIGGAVQLYKIHRDDQHIRLIISMKLSFWLTGCAAWGTAGLVILGLPTDGFSVDLILKAIEGASLIRCLLALTGGFFAGLVAGSGAAFIRFQSSPLSKGMGIAVSGQVTKAAAGTLQDGGTNLQK